MGERLDKKDLTPQSWEQTITIHILLNISRSDGNKTMKFVRLIEYNVRKFFLQKLSKK